MTASKLPPSWSITPLKKILVVRNDKLGDFMLAYPSFATLKTNMPETIVCALVPAYTHDMAKSCPWIDKILIDQNPTAKWTSAFALANLFAKEQFDAIVTLYSTTRVGFAAKIAGIPFRHAPATKWAQIFYNSRFSQHRSRSEKPEYLYNQDLVRQFLRKHKITENHFPEPPYLQFRGQEIALKRRQFCERNNISLKNPLVFIHCGSGGSANNLSIAQFAVLAKKLRFAEKHTTVLTAGPDDLKKTQRLALDLPNTPHIILESNDGLLAFSKSLQFADLFISGSTGPLHIAGALDTPTVAFYPRRRSATALRWQTLNTPEKRLSFSPDKEGSQTSSLDIDIESAAAQISQTFLKK